MSIREKLSTEDLRLYEIIRHPVLLQEFIRNYDKRETEEAFEFDIYQKEMACDFNSEVSFSCARAVGKTWTLTSVITWILINRIYPEDYIIYAVPNKVHLKPVWDELVRQYRTNSVLKHFIAKSTGINASDYTIKLKNGTTLMCRIAGNDGTGRNMVGLHTPFFIVDEGALFEWKSWIELQPTIKRHLNGSRLIVSGVPTGFRESNVLFFVDEISDRFTKHRVSAFQNPRYSDEDHERDIDQYGGKDSDGYIRNVLGQHGTPISAMFDRNLMKLSNYPVYKFALNGTELREDVSLYREKLIALPPLPASAKEVIIGMDPGYTDPSCIVVLYKDRTGQFRFHLRLQMNRVPYPIQAQVLDYLDSKYKPILIGFDEGSSGKSELQRIRMDPGLQHKNYEERLVPVAFQANISMGFDNDGGAIEQRIKPFSVTLLQEFVNTHRIVFTTTDLEMISELERMTFSRTAAGNTVYKTISPSGSGVGDDHYTSALLCAVFAYYTKYELLQINPQNKKLISAKWGY